ncbi:MAG: surfeit locus 1 family protein [Bermanella sp.]|jgi:surfeit locus 1 family protein
MTGESRGRSWGLALLVVIMAAVLLGLGYWQLQRADEKRTLIQAQAQQRDLPALRVASSSQILPEYRAVIVRGRFDAARYWLLENRIFRGRYGFEVVSPFTLTDGSSLLVHRGWLPGDRSRRELPQVDTPSGELELMGFIDQGGATGFQLAGASEDAGWPKRVQWLPAEQAAAALDVRLPDVLLRLQEGEPGMYTQTYHAVNMPPQKHVGYAVQWFGMAAIISFLYVLRLWRQRTSRGSLRDTNG